MVPYLFIFLLSCAGFLFDKYFNKYSILFFNLIFLYLLILIGLRYEIGGDWINYLQNHAAIHFSVFTDKHDDVILYNTEPFIIILNILSPNVYIFNFYCALVFLIGLFALISKCKDIYLSIVVAIPFLILLVGLGYQKQSVALGLLMLSYYFYLNNNYKLFLIFSFTTFFSHYSTFFLILFIFYDLFYFKKFRINKIYIFIIIVLIFLVIFIGYDKITRVLINNYINDENRTNSYGLIPRLAVQFLSIFLYFISFNKWHKKTLLNRLIIFNIFLTFLTLPFVLTYSNLIDRMLFYFMLIQIMILGNYKLIILSNYYVFFRFAIFAFYLCITLYWFTFSYFASYWLPYKNIIIPMH